MRGGFGCLVCSARSKVEAQIAFISTRHQLRPSVASKFAALTDRDKVKAQADKLPPTLEAADKAAQRAAATARKEAEREEAARLKEAAKEAEAAAAAARRNARKKRSTPDSPEKPDSPPMPPPRPRQNSHALPLGWKSARDGDGQMYYYNRNLDISQYDFPQLSSSASPQSPPLPPPKSAGSSSNAPSHSRSSADVNSAEKVLVQQLYEQMASLQAQLLHANRKERLAIEGRLAVLRVQLAQFKA